MDPLPLHLGHAGPPRLSVRLAFGVVAGLLAAMVANVPMQRLREGETPPFVVGRALTGKPLREVPGSLATAVHYGGGAAGGLAVTLVAYGFEQVIPIRPMIPGATLPAYPFLAALAVTALAAYALFAFGLLPTVGGDARDRAARVRRDWGVSVLVYAVALGVAVPVVLAVSV